jgi:purine-nucleoside phosphorylase
MFQALMTDNELDIIIQPRRGRNEAALPELALLVVNHAEAQLALAIARRRGGIPRSLAHAGLLVDKHDRFCLAGPALGAPAAVILMEKLVALGVKRLVLFSCCGSLDPSLSIGNILVADRAVIGEGVSRWYGRTGQVLADPDMIGSLENVLLAAEMSWRRGVLWSTDAPYRERRSELLELREYFGVAGVDMECSALYSLAAFRSVAVAALFLISDELWTNRWRPGFTSDSFKKRSRMVLETLLGDGLSSL